jgi:hypothetical protein
VKTSTEISGRRLHIKSGVQGKGLELEIENWAGVMEDVPEVMD